MTTNEWRALIGKRIRYSEGDSALWRYGTVTSVEGKNVWIDGDPKWIPDLKYVSELL